MGPQAPRVFAVANAIEVGVCLGLGHLPGFDHTIETFQQSARFLNASSKD
jgi:hypothetical protein